MALIVGTNTSWGLEGGPGETLISGRLEALASLLVWSGTLVALAVAAAAMAWQVGRKALAVVAALVAANVVGVLASEYVGAAVDLPAGVPFGSYAEAFGLVVYRSFFLIPVIPMLLVVRFMDRGGSYPFQIGDWKERTRVLIPGRGQQTWKRVMVWYFLLLFVPFFIFQSMVGFEPITSGRLRVFLPAILGIAFFNAAVEEIVFRGLFMPPLIRAVGAPAGIWLQGIAFGLMHWGSAPDAVSGLPMALFIGFLSIVAAKAVVEARGLAWAVVAHMLADIVLHSASSSRRRFRRRPKRWIVPSAAPLLRPLLCRAPRQIAERPGERPHLVLSERFGHRLVVHLELVTQAPIGIEELEAHDAVLPPDVPDLRDRHPQAEAECLADRALQDAPEERVPLLPLRSDVLPDVRDHRVRQGEVHERVGEPHLQLAVPADHLEPLAPQVLAAEVDLRRVPARHERDQQYEHQ